MRYVLVMLALLVGCDMLGPPSLQITKKRPIAPPLADLYVAWYEEAETCLGVQGNVGAVTWYRAESIRYNGQRSTGLWLPPDDIVITLAYRTSARVVRHESIHHILQTADHDPKAFACEGS